MVLNIGGNEYVLTKDIIAILDRDSIDENKIFNEFVSKIEERIDLDELKDPKVRSYLILKDKEGTNIRVSEISSGTLYKRNKIKKWR